MELSTDKFSIFNEEQEENNSHFISQIWNVIYIMYGWVKTGRKEEKEGINFLCLDIEGKLMEKIKNKKIYAGPIYFHSSQT